MRSLARLEPDEGSTLLTGGSVASLMREQCRRTADCERTDGALEKAPAASADEVVATFCVVQRRRAHTSRAGDG